jgi:hypothetical protein
VSGLLRRQGGAGRDVLSEFESAHLRVQLADRSRIDALRIERRLNQLKVMWDSPSFGGEALMR